MLTVEKPLHITIAEEFLKPYQKEEILFFDIETTGFAPDVTALYLIGCIYYKKGSWYLLQWFSDNNTSELQILQTFFEWLRPYRLLIHFNGTGFDIPYLLKKCQKYQLPYTFSSIHSLDIYKEIAPYRKIFALKNLKQRTLEQFIGKTRTNSYTGSELISVYGRYLKAKLANHSDAEQLFPLLLAHNEEDLKGLTQLLELLSYPLFFHSFLTPTGHCLNKKTEEFLLYFSLPVSIPKEVSYGNQDGYFSAFRKEGILKVPLYRGELKFFYRNYKDYYYLPKEDTAVHKSVAFYVDKNFRTKAKAANCYSRKTGCFIPQFSETIIPYFKIDFQDSITYIETTDDFLSNQEQLSLYLHETLQHLVQ